MKLNKFIVSLCLVLFLGGFLPALAQNSGKPKHIILLLDTSGSVAENQMVEPIQAIAKEVLSRKKADDIVSILTFSTRVLKRVDRSQEDIEGLFEKVKSYRSSGGWTFTAAMLKKLVQEISREESYARHIFILSDGLDDPPTKTPIDLDRFQGAARVFYIRALTENTAQETLIKQVFPQVSVKIVDINNPLIVQKSLALLDDDFTLKGVALQLPLDFKFIADRKNESFKVQISANDRLAGKKFVFKAEADNPIFKQQIDEKKKKNFQLESSAKFNVQLQEGANSFVVPYFIPETEAGKIYDVVFSLALPQDAGSPLFSKDIQVNVIALTFFEKFAQLPIVYFVLLFIGLAIVIFILYRCIRYQLFKPLIELTYWYDNSRLEESTGKTEKSKMELSNLLPGKYVISARPDAFLVLPNLSTYDELILIKKGKKFKTRVRIHTSSLRNLEGLGGGNIRKKRIRNGTAFKLGRYMLSFRTNL